MSAKQSDQEQEKIKILIILLIITYPRSLCQVIKDHNWPDAIETAKKSTENFIHRVFNAEFEPFGGIPMDKSEKLSSITRSSEKGLLKWLYRRTVVQ